MSSRSVSMVSVALIAILVINLIPASAGASVTSKVISWVQSSLESGSEGPSSTSDQPVAAHQSIRPEPPKRVIPKPPPAQPEEPSVTMEVGADKPSTLTSVKGDVRVSFPQGALTEAATVTYTPMPPAVSDTMVLFKVFSLEASSSLSSAPITRFAKDLQIDLTYTEADIAGMDARTLKLYYFDEGKSRWLPVPSTVDQAEHKISGTTDHFTVYGGGATPAYSLPGTIMSFQTSLASGASTASYPLELPDGPGGLKPNLTLVYNSGGVDEMKNARDVGSWVGMGWTLHTSRISYNEDESKYNMEFDGGSYEIILGTDEIYRIQDQFWKIIKPDDNTFEMWDNDGTHYVFGGTSDSVQYRYKSTGNINYRYDLSLIKDTHENQISISYAQDIYPPVVHSNVRSAYPVDINYGVNNLVNIHFNSSFDITGNPTDGNLRNDNPRSFDDPVYGGYPAPMIMENKKLDSVVVSVDGDQVRKYQFAYTTTSSLECYDGYGTFDWIAGKHTLTSITQYGTDTTTLPAMTFSYQNKTTRYYNASGSTAVTFSWPHLYQVNSGFGGTVTYTYAERPVSPARAIWTREVVTAKSVNPGVGPVQTTNYTYIGYPKQVTDPSTPDYSNLVYRGYDQVEESDAAGNVVRHYFYANGYYRVELPIGGYVEQWAEFYPGKEYRTEWVEKGTVVKAVFKDWQYCDFDDGHMQRPLLWGAGEIQGGKTSWTSYQYDDYGNVTVEQKFPDVNETGGESATIRTFFPYTTDWIVNKVARVSTYDSAVDEEDPDGIGLVERTYYYYDGSTDFTTSPSLGDLTMTVRALSASVSGPASYFEYDSYGNLTDETDPNGNTTSHTYDSTYYTYPVGKTYPEISGSPPLQMTESYEWDYVLGKPLSETDVNGQTTSYVYDTLGRRTKEIRPGDDSTYPTVRYTYVSWGTLSSQNVKMEQKVASNDYQWQKTYFDGLGRVLQVQERAESSQSIVSSTTAYNSRGQVDKKYVSWLLGSEQSTYQTPSSSLQYTSYEYDVLGRATSVKNADGTRTGTDFMAPLAQAATDAKGSKKNYAYDGLGNMTQVGEYDLAPAYLSQFGNSGQLSNPQGMTAVRGGLTIVADTGNNNILKYQGGTLQSTVGAYGSGSEQFNGPYDVEATGDGLYYYVADTGNNRISQWSNKVFPLSQFGTYGKEIGQLNSPNGIAANSAVTYIYVADTYNNRIVEFNSSGSYVRKWGTYGTGNSQFNGPYDLTIDGSGYVYVVDNGNNRILKYNSSGSYISQWGTNGTGNGQFDSPRAIAYGNNYIYVVDTMNYRVQYFNTSGNYQGQWGSEGTGTSQFGLPTGITVGPDGSVYVADWYGIQKFSSTGDYVSRILNDSDIEGQQWIPQHIAVDGSSNLYVTDWNRVLVFASGSFVESFGKTGSDLGEFNVPMGIYYDRTNDKVYLADSWNHRVQKFEASTKVVRTWGSSGSGNGQFSAPKGVGIDDSGNVYVADTNNNRVQKFTPDGAYSTKWGSSGSGDGQFNHPWDVAVDFNGNVYVADKDNNRVQKFDTSGTFVAKWTVTAPTRIAIDGAGYVYVSDATNNRVQKFTPEGTLLLSLGSWGTGNGQFSGPQGIALAGDSLNELQVVDSGNTRVQSFDALGTLYSTTSYAYDVRGNMTQVVDDASNTTDITYNFLSQKTEMSDPDLGTWSYTYDDNGNLASQTDALDQTLAFRYDPLNRMIEKRTPDLEGTLLASFSYDSVSGGNYGLGLRTGMTDAAGSVTYKYDTRGRTIREDRVIDNTTYTTQYTYDPADRLATVTYPTNEVVTQTYSARNLPYSVSGSVAGTLVSSAAYNQLGQMSQIDLGNGLRTVFNYFGVDSVDGGDSSSYFGKLYRIKTYVAATPTTVRQHQKYWWDADGNLTARTDVLAYSETESFSYDFLDRITGVSSAYSESYAYDEIGNMTSKNNVSYTYGSSAGPHAVTSVGAYTQSYDANGNMTGRANSTGTQTLTWNVENQLYQVEGTGGGYSGTATYTYDGDGNRIKKVEGSITTVYPNKYYERNIVNNTTTDTSYYYMGGKLVATKKSSTLEYLHQDSLSSTALSTNSSGSQVSATKYLPFGSTRSSSGTLSTSRMFTSQHMDSGSDLYFYNARYYDAALGRFISPDTIIPGASDPQAFNRYSYVLNNPLKYTDPSGHMNVSDAGGNGNRGPTNTYTVFYAYYENAAAGLGFYHGEMVVVSEAGEYYKIKTWGPAIDLGAGYTMDAFGKGQTIIADDISQLSSFGATIQFGLSLFDWTSSTAITVDENGVSVESVGNERIVLGFGFGPQLQLTYTWVRQISAEEANDMPNWVKYELDYDDE